MSLSLDVFHANVFFSVVQVVSPDELKEDNEYEEIVEDMREECGRYGDFLHLSKSPMMALVAMENLILSAK
jgi:hypothetical protein